MNTHTSDKNKTAFYGYAGALLFLFLAQNLWTGWPLFSGFALQTFLLFSALTLAFLGGVRWGMVVTVSHSDHSHEEPEAKHAAAPGKSLFLAVFTCLYALGCLLLTEPLHQLAGLFAGFLLLLIFDLISTVSGNASKHKVMVRGRLKLVLGVMVLIAHAVVIAKVLQWS